MAELSKEILEVIKRAQKNEITEYHVYSMLARHIKDPANASVLRNIAEDEKKHYNFWMRFTGIDQSPSRITILKYYWIARIFGITFGIKLMEKNEEKAEEVYGKVAGIIPEAMAIAAEEDSHEHQLIALIKEEKLQYVGSVVLGLNDALVELTGSLAGFTFALQNNRIIALAGLITGIAAAFSMAASEYLSNKAENAGEKAGKAALYTGIAYIFTVLLLILPFLLLSTPIISLIITLTTAVIIIWLFNYYLSVATDIPFRKRFLEMTFVSLGVAALSFGIGFALKTLMGIDI
ncbi:MAG: rubrerythrin family protein [Bacteroidales bacterium]|jgi:VIT1/CCC1 family predicted Fe2+/Mn2+ transporter|nr:rubrerythrin family protein [Bacteroidales bacterium]